MGILVSSGAVSFFQVTYQVFYPISVLLILIEPITEHPLPGLNTTVSLQAHEGSIPGLPDLGRALSGIKLDVMVPKLGIPGEGGDDSDDGDEEGNPRFIKDATVYLFLLFALSFTINTP